MSSIFGSGLDVVFLEEGSDLELQLKELQNKKRRKRYSHMGRGKTLLIAVFGLLAVVAMIAGGIYLFTVWF